MLAEKQPEGLTEGLTVRQPLYTPRAPPSSLLSSQKASAPLPSTTHPAQVPEPIAANE